MKFSDGKNLIETGTFDKYKKRRIEEICEFLGIPTNEFQYCFMKQIGKQQAEKIKKLQNDLETIQMREHKLNVIV